MERQELCWSHSVGQFGFRRNQSVFQNRSMECRQVLQKIHSNIRVHTDWVGRSSWCRGNHNMETPESFCFELRRKRQEDWNGVWSDCQRLQWPSSSCSNEIHWVWTGTEGSRSTSLQEGCSDHERIVHLWSRIWDRLHAVVQWVEQIRQRRSLSLSWSGGGDKKTGPSGRKSET